MPTEPDDPRQRRAELARRVRARAGAAPASPRRPRRRPPASRHWPARRSSSSGNRPAMIADDDRGEDGDPHRRAAARHAARPAGQQPVARHGEEDPALAVEEGEDHGRQRDRRPTAPRILRRPRLADLAQDQRQRLGAVGEARVGDRADRGRRDRHVDERRTATIEPTMPMARSRSGFLASSAAVAIASKP